MILLSVSVLWFSSQPMAQYQILEMENQLLQIEENNKTSTNLFRRPDDNQTLTKITAFRVIESPISPWLIALDYLTLAWFLIDISVRFIFSPDKYNYLIKFDNMIDIVATLWLIADIILNFYITSFFIHRFVFCFEILEINFRLYIYLFYFSLQVVRVLRLFRLLSYHAGLKVIILSISKSAAILNLLLFFLIIASTWFGALIFFAEKLTTSDPNNNLFISIPDAFWFSLVSLTTIGYGDISPVTMLGKFYSFFFYLKR